MITNEIINEYPNGFFDRAFKWDESEIEKLGNGYLVQKIERKTKASYNFDCSGKEYNHTYFEAWKIENGKIVYNLDYEEPYDDKWVYSAFAMHDMFWAKMKDYKSKYQTAGVVRILGTVFFASEGSSAAKEVEEKFAVGEIPFASDLLSSFVFESEKDLSPIFEHHICETWDLFTAENMIDALIKDYKKSEIILEDAIEYIKIFADLDFYEDLYKSIIKSYKQKTSP